jgi:hypothetical protein
VGVVARSVSGLGLMDSMNEILSGHSQHTLSAAADDGSEGGIHSGSSGVGVGGKGVVSVSVDGLGESMILDLDTDMHGNSDGTFSSGSGSGGYGVHSCLSLGDYPVGSIHHYDYPLYGTGNWTACRQIVEDVFRSRIEKEVDLSCLQVTHQVAWDNMKCEV